MAGSAQYKFGVLAKIVKHLKTIHQGGGDYALTFDEILDETNQLDVSMKIRQVIITQLILYLSFIVSLNMTVAEN